MASTTDDLVYLQYGSDEPADGELVQRSQLPETAYETGGAVAAENAGGEPGVFYRLWIVEA